MCVAIDYTQKIITVMQEATVEKERLFNLVHQYDLKTCDLLHEIELQDIHGMYDAYLILKELKQIRQARRKAKDELEILKIFENFKDTEEKQCEDLIASIMKKERKMQYRQYNPRVDCKPTQI